MGAKRKLEKVPGKGSDFPGRGMDLNAMKKKRRTGKVARPRGEKEKLQEDDSNVVSRKRVKKRHEKKNEKSSTV